DNGWVIEEDTPYGQQNLNRRRLTIYSYNDLGWLTKIDRDAEPGGFNRSDTIISYGYFPDGILRQGIRRGSAYEDVRLYDGLQRNILSRKDDRRAGGSSVGTRMAFDILGRETYRSRPLAVPNLQDGITTTYDALSRVTKTEDKTDTLVHATTTTRYSSGVTVEFTDSIGAITRMRYRAFGHPDNKELVFIRQPEGILTDIFRSADFGLITEVRQKDTEITHSQKYFYNDEQELCRHSVPEAGDTLYAYDEAGQKIREVRGQPSEIGCKLNLGPLSPIAYSYDSLGRQTKIDFSDATPDITFGYAINSQIIAVNRGNYRWFYRIHNSDEKVTEARLTELSSGRIWRTSYSFNNDEQLTYQTVPSGRTFKYNPDGLGRPQYVMAEHPDLPAEPFHYIDNIVWRADGTVESATLDNGNGVSLSTMQNPRQLLKNITVRKGTNAPILNLNYEYDTRAKVTDIDHGAGSDWSRTFGYDDLGRLTNVSFKNASQRPISGAVYDYDAIGNIKSRVIDGVNYGFSYNSTTNRLSKIYRDGAQLYTFAYDERGNTTNNGRTTFSYDAAEQPTTINGVATGAIYDGNLRRVRQTINGRTFYTLYGAEGELVSREEI
ncbi:MAG: hypothetical protein AAFY04_07125, partial [Pseudomonadota bacterium]